MIGLAATLLGFMLLLTPSILAAMAGVKTDEDLIRWLADQPLEFIFAARAMMSSGIGMIIAGAALMYMPS